MLTDAEVDGLFHQLAVVYVRGFVEDFDGHSFLVVDVGLVFAAEGVGAFVDFAEGAVS